MADVEITLMLPAELAEKAREAGLLEAERLADYVDAGLKRDAARRELKEMVASLRSATPILTEAEIEAELASAKGERLQVIFDQCVMNFVNEEIHAYRAEKAAKS